MLTITQFLNLCFDKIKREWNEEDKYREFCQDNPTSRDMYGIPFTLPGSDDPYEQQSEVTWNQYRCALIMETHCEMLGKYVDQLEFKDYQFILKLDIFTLKPYYNLRFKQL